MPRMSKIELFAAIRRDLAAGMSGRAIEEKYRIGQRTVSAAMASALPPPRKAMPPRGSKLDPFKPAIDEILRADLDAPRKQRHTVRRIYHRLLDEHGMADISYQVVRTYVADRKPKIRAEFGHYEGLLVSRDHPSLALVCFVAAVETIARYRRSQIVVHAVTR
jgi:hypothetical protein